MGGFAGTAGGASRELEDRPAPFNNRQTVARFSSAALLLVLLLLLPAMLRCLFLGVARFGSTLFLAKCLADSS